MQVSKICFSMCVRGNTWVKIELTKLREPAILAN